MIKKKILLIDDDADITNATKAILESKDYEVDIANDKTKGLEKAKTFLPDLIILDVMMDDISDGFELANEFRGIHALRKIPILMYTGIDKVTGVNFRSAYSHSDQLPVNAYLNKPASPQAILDEVQRLLC